MSQAFLDKGILIGFCFTVDSHHQPCLKYLSTGDKEFFITEEIEEVFDRRKKDLSDRHERAVLRHVEYLENSHFSGELGPMELHEIRTHHLPSGEESHFLNFYYQNVVPDILSLYELKENLRGLARDISALAIRRKRKFDEIVEMWVREDEHPRVQEKLRALREDDLEDFWVCIDAHDLASKKSGHSELATTDLGDFIRSGRRELIIESTDLNDVVAVATTK